MCIRDRALPMAIKIAEEVLEKKIGSSSSEETMEVGGLNYIADVYKRQGRYRMRIWSRVIWSAIPAMWPCISEEAALYTPVPEKKALR